ncbi:MAG: amidohydrolase family protein [Rhodospirillaceae bacterium]|nr:amidohydrolase family protein [Rhodospirillaceae bacterium]
MKTSFLICLALTTPAGAEDFDLAIRNARIVDGSGGAPVTGDVLVKGDTIAAVGRIPAGAKIARIIDAQDRVLAPGFIDAHAHGEALDAAQGFENFLAQGVTTIVLGQDGSSPDGTGIEPGAKPVTLADWFRRLEKSPPPVNIATLVGFGSVRDESGAPYNGPATPAQIARFSQLIDTAMAQGAYGASLGMEYVPMISATPQELAAVGKAVGRYDGVVMSHMRSEDDDKLAAAIDELLAVGAESRVHVSHIKVVYGQTAAQGQAVLDQLAAARARGVRVTADVYPYLASQSGLALLFPDWAKVKKDFDSAKRERGQELADYLTARVMKRGGPKATLLSTKPYVGMTLEDIARERRKPFTDVLLDLGPAGGSAAYFIMSAPTQDVFIKSPDVMTSSDGSPAMNHPRAYGSFARMIETYVRKEGLPLPLAVRKMSAMTAAVLKLPDRGLIKAGYKADLVLFDPAKVHETATWEKPQQLAAGFDLVMINGKVARENGVTAKDRFGAVLKNAAKPRA